MYSVIFILVYCFFSFDAVLLRNTRAPKSSCSNEFIYDVNGRETLYLDNADKTVDFECQASISTYNGNLELRLLDLNITTSNLELVENPPGWDLPITIEGELQQRPATKKYGRDTDPSYAIKMAVISLLPTQEFTKMQQSIDLQQIKATEDLIKEGDKKIVLKDDVKDLILVMGNTGSGKTTLVQWLAGDRSKLVAREVIPGLEEFIIEDTQDKISRSTISSKTTFPELVIDAESNNYYYDLPGFSDTRNSTFDIANSYFIKKVLDHANSVKILLTVSYSSVQEGVDRHDFIQLLRHASQLINDIKKFESSIALVVTKVDNHIVKNRNFNVFVEDDKIISGIASFLMKCKHDLEQRIKNGLSNGSVSFNEQAIDLIEILLNNNDIKYQKIRIFRRPYKAGPLIASDLLENERRYIRILLHENIFFTVKNDEDFGRTLSDNTIKEIKKLTNVVDISLLNNICSIADKIHVHVLNLVKQIYFRIDELNSIQTNLNSSNRTEIERLISGLKNDSYIITELDNKIRNIKNVSSLEILIGDALRELNLSPALAKNVTVFGHYIDFLNSISESHTSISSIAWASSFHEVIVYLAVEQKLIQNHAMSLFYEKDNIIKIKILQLSSQLINFFKEIENNNNDMVILGNELTAYYDRFSESLQISNKHSTVENFYIVMDILNSVNINFEDYVLSKVLEDHEYSYLLKNEIKRVIDYLDESTRWYAFTLRFYNYLSEYDVRKKFKYLKSINNLGSNIIVRGSDVEKLLKEYWQDFYKGEYENIKDITLNEPKLEHLQHVILQSIQKPDPLCTDDGKLVVKGHNVNLRDILYIKCPQTVKIIEIFALNKFYIDCEFDKTGESIQLFIIAPTWDVQDNSKIVLDGSSGPNHYYRKAPDGAKDGLDGEDGKPGLPGTSSGKFFGIVLNFTNDEEFIVSVDGGNGGKGQDGGDGARGSDGTTPYIENPEKYLTNKGWYYNKNKYQGNFLSFNYDPIYGNNCTNGGDGGRGGHGGYGGFPGEINFVLLSTQKLSTSKGKVGKMGPHGSSGAPGMAGSNGGYAIIDWAALRVGKTMSISYFEMQNCLSGNVKTNEVNERGISEPQKSALLKPFYVINEYKEFLRESLKDSVAASNMREFLTKLETDVSIQNLYDASGFLDDMLTLESHSYKFHNKTDLLCSYQSLLNRINKYIAFANHDSKNNPQELRILHILQVAIQSKSYKISNDLENYLVIDVKKYFEFLIKQINKYARSLKELKIDKYRDHYQNNMKSEIKKANNILIQNVIPETDKQYVNIDQQIKMLVRDIISKKYEAENRKENLVKKQRELAQSMLMKKGLMVLKMFTKVVDIFSFVSELASNVLGFVVDSDTIENLSKTQKSIESLSVLFENDQKCLKGNLEEFTDTESPEDDDLFDNIKRKVKPLIKLLNTGYEQYNNYIEGKKHTKNELKEYRNKLNTENDVIDVNNNFSDPLNHDKKENNQVSLKINEVNRVEKNIRISEVCCRNGSVNGDEVSALGGEIENIVNQIDVLNDLEQYIYDSLPPLKAKLEYNLNKFGLSTVNASHAEIDYNNMKIQQIIEKFRTRMNIVTQFANDEIKSKIKSCIDNLQNGVLLVTKINDRINDYYDNMKFGNYIADLNSDDETQVTDNQVLNNDLHKLQVIAQSNVILQEYEKASMAFRQYMFPFVGLYLDQIILENNSTNTIEPLVRNAIRTIEFLTDELTKDATVIKKKTYRIYPDIRFDGSDFEKPPFFVFAREHHEKEISDLLNGNEIILTANITNGLKKNAIKFREIGIRIVATNEDIQSALNNELSKFLIEMTHNGDSYYRCDDKFYVINHNAISMKHSVLKEADGTSYYHLDHTSTLVRNNPPMCSPYTTWKVRLVNKNDYEDFSNLSLYENDIKELALEGWGQYVEMGLDVCNDDLKKFYKAYDYFPESDTADFVDYNANY